MLNNIIENARKTFQVLNENNEHTKKVHTKIQNTKYTKRNKADMKNIPTERRAHFSE